MKLIKYYLLNCYIRNMNNKTTINLFPKNVQCIHEKSRNNSPIKNEDNMVKNFYDNNTLPVNVTINLNPLNKKYEKRKKYNISKVKNKIQNKKKFIYENDKKALNDNNHYNYFNYKNGDKIKKINKTSRSLESLRLKNESNINLHSTNNNMQNNRINNFKNENDIKDKEISLFPPFFSQDKFDSDLDEFNIIEDNYYENIIVNNSSNEFIMCKNNLVKLKHEYQKLIINYKKLNNVYKLKEESYKELKKNYEQLEKDNKILIEENEKFKKDYNEIFESNKLLKNASFDELYKCFEDFEEEKEELITKNKELKKQIKELNKKLDLKIQNSNLFLIEKQTTLNSILSQNKNFKNLKNDKICKINNINLEGRNLEIYKKIEDVNPINIKLKEENVILFSYNSIKKNNLIENNISSNIILYEENEGNEYNENNGKFMNEILDVNDKLQKENKSIIEYYNKLEELYNQLKIENNNLKNNKILNANIKYIFPTKSFYKNDSNYYLNSIIQSLLHISELDNYFLNEYPKNSLIFKQKNKNNTTKGEISSAFYNLVKNICEEESDKEDKTLYIKNNKKRRNTCISRSRQNSEYIEKLKKVISSHNIKLEKLQSDNYNHFIQYLLQIMHEELNNLEFKNLDNLINKIELNQSNNIFNDFTLVNNIKNNSIFSKLFYGIYEDSLECNFCKNITFNYQNFGFISFDTKLYNKKVFNIYNGFEDNQKKSLTSIELHCQYCNKLSKAEYCRKIIEPPTILIITINYNENNELLHSKINFEEIIDITKYISFNFGYPIKYRILSVCTLFRDNYINYCWNKENQKWYKFNDSYFSESQANDIFIGSPYLLLYEKL